MRFLPSGDAALLVEVRDLNHVLALYRLLRAQPIHGVEDLVPAACTLLVKFDPNATSASAIATALRDRAGMPASRLNDTSAATSRLIVIPVSYQGEDLCEVAEWMGVPVSEVIARHSSQPWSAVFVGFAPGFAYLAGGHPSFHAIPRRKTPRTRVPAGSVALAGDFSAVYPTASPGGWQLIGTTDVVMWDLLRSEPAYIQVGSRVQFVDADVDAEHVRIPRAKLQHAAPTRHLPESTGSAIEVVATGLQTLLQDRGRCGFASVGVSPSGALDVYGMRQANRLVGNPIDTPVLETLAGGLRLRCHGRVTLAIAGARAVLTVRSTDGRQWQMPNHAPVPLDEGDQLDIGPSSTGVRSYIAARGGWQVSPVLGSCATDTLSQVGPPAVQSGQLLYVGDMHLRGNSSATLLPDVCLPELPRPGTTVQLDVILGPRSDWFTNEALTLLAQQAWQVTPQCNRIGIRLLGNRPLERTHNEELLSEGTVSGAIQVPTDGQPVLFLADHPLTGGYPVIAVVVRDQVALAAQVPVGCTVRFRIIAAPLEVG